MLIICEDCAKRYNIDESRIKGNRARFTCKECGHIIIVDKTDISRPLISAKSASKNISGTIDLLREMEGTAAPDILDETHSAEAEKKLEKEVLATKKSTPIVLYLVMAFLAAFICVNGSLAFLYFFKIVPLLQKSNQSSDVLFSSLGLIGVVWVFVLGIFYGIARSLAGSITSLKEGVVAVVRGEEGGSILPNGPREVRELADILSRIITRQ